MKKEADWKILATLGFLVATVAVPTVASLVSPEAVETSTAPKTPTEISSADSREPASIAATASNPKAHVINFDVRCAPTKLKTFKAEGSYVQLKGRDCNKGKSNASIVITNKTNGFTASIFPVSANEYQTDLIQLKNGENQISIQVQSSAGPTEEQVLKIQSNEI